METKEHIISVFDLENFVRIAKELSSEETFTLTNVIYNLIIDETVRLNPYLLKNMGDGNLVIFDNSNPDLIIRSLLKLKSDIESLIMTKGFNNKVSISSHIGEITIGDFGKEPFDCKNAFGEAINTTFLMNGKPFKGRINISPQLFGKLDSETRKLFHKYTPQVVYIAD